MNRPGFSVAKRYLRSSGRQIQEYHQRYLVYWIKATFPQDCMRRLRSDFETWMINKSQQFWLDWRIHNSAMKMAAKWRVEAACKLVHWPKTCPNYRSGNEVYSTWTRVNDVDDNGRRRSDGGWSSATKVSSMAAEVFMLVVGCYLLFRYILSTYEIL